MIRKSKRKGFSKVWWHRVKKKNFFSYPFSILFSFSMTLKKYGLGWLFSLGWATITEGKTELKNKGVREGLATSFYKN